MNYCFILVIPAQAGIHCGGWIPACAGMTKEERLFINGPLRPFSVMRTVMRKTLYPAALALLLAVSATPAGAADVIARLGTADITTDDIRAYVETLPPADQAALAKEPALLTQVVRVYLANRLVLKEAREAKFDQQPATKAQL